jgi:hypothetical protein
MDPVSADHLFMTVVAASDPDKDEGRPAGSKPHGWIRTVRRPGSVALLLLAMVVSATMLTETTSQAAFTSSSSNLSNSLTAGTWCNADRPAIIQVQKGSLTNNTTGTTSVTVNAVTMSRAFLLYTVRMNNSNPDRAEIAGRLASSTSIQFVRSSSVTAPLTVEWTLVEYGCGVSVQRGQYTKTSCNQNVTITPVSSLSRAFVTWNEKVDSTSNWDTDNNIVAELTSTTNLNFWCEYVGALGNGRVVYWQVIEFTDPAAIHVQAGVLTGPAFASGQSSRTVTLGTPVDLSRTFVLVTATNPIDVGASDHLGKIVVSGRLSNSTTLVLERSVTGVALARVQYQVIELKDGSYVQSGTATITAGNASTTAPLTPIDAARSSAVASGQYASGLGFGASTDTTSDNPGNASFTLAVTSTQLTMTRDATSGTATVPWYVIHWGD